MLQHAPSPSISRMKLNIAASGAPPHPGENIARPLARHNGGVGIAA